MTNEQQTNHPGRTGLMVLALILCCTTAISVTYLAHERGILRALGADRDQVNLELTQARSQIRTLTEQVDALSAAPAAPVALAPPSSTVKRRHTAASGKVSKPPAEDKRLSQMQNQLAEQQKALASTREDIQKTHDDLQNKLDSTRDDLNGSIARTHEEVVALQKRGELNVYEFRMTKSKSLQRVGPLQVGLRKTNSKHKFYDLSMLVDDMRLDKKHVNLYEPVWITLADRTQPLELVVNQVGKDSVAGYLSEPKYKKSELAASASGSSRAQPLDAPTAQ